MADNVIIPASGTGDTTPTIAADDVGGAKYQRVKISVGADGVVGDATPANPLPVDDADSQVLYGALTETAPATDTASSGLNGRLQRIAQRLTSLIAQIPATLGQKTSANSLAVVVASDQSAVPVSGTVTANIGTAGTLALDATLTGGTQKSKLVDTGGTNVASVSAAGALKVDNSAVTQPVSGTVTTTPPSNASTNVAQVAGTTADTNSGNKSAGTLRVTLATDQVQLTNALKVDPSAVTSPVSLASVPSHAVTNAGTFAVQSVETRATTGAAPSAFTATSSTQIFASNASRKLFTVYNNSDQNLFLMLASAAASTTSYHVLVKANGGYFETDNYSGEIRGIMAATINTGQVNPGEYT